MSTVFSSKRRHRQSARSALAVISGLLLLAGSLSACGNDIEAASSTTKASTTTSDEAQTTTSDAGGLTGGNVGLGSKLGEEAVSLPGLNGGSSDETFGPDVESCLDEEAADLSEADYDAVINDDDFAGLSPEGTEIVTAAMNTCIPPEEIATVFSEEFSKELGSEPNPQFTACLSTDLEGQVGDLLVEASLAENAGGDEIPQPVIDLQDACGDIIISDLFFQQFKESGLRDEVAQCIADGLEGKVTMSDLIELGQGGELPASLEADIEKLAKECEAAG